MRSSTNVRLVRPLVLAAITVASLLPFLGKAYHVDEPLFVWMAQQIQAHPLDPYGFQVNWYGTLAPMAEVMRNPPLVPYVMAGWGALAGFSEISMHALFLLPAVLAVLGTYRLAAPLCRRPDVAALAALSTPLFFVSATSTMCDVAMVACWVWALSFWMQALRDDDRGTFVTAALVAAGCVLTKYSGVLLLPLMAAAAMTSRQPLRAWAPWLAVPVVVLGVFLAWLSHAYGREALLEAARLATEEHPVARVADAGRQALIVLAFAGGGCVVAMTSALSLWPRASALVGAAAIGLGSLGALAVMGAPFADAARGVQAALLLAGGAAVIALVVVELRRREIAGLMLALWVGFIAIFSGFVAWSVSARYLLPMAPGVAILVARAMDARRLTGWRAWTPIVASGAIALLVAQGDAALAGSAKRAVDATFITRAGQPGAIYFQGHWGFQYYMEKRGAKAVDMERPILATGDVMVLPSNNANVVMIDPKWIRQSVTLTARVKGWVSTINPALGAGFHSSVFGPVPFVVGKALDEKYVVVTIGSK